MEKFFDELHKAEFGYGYNEETPLYPKSDKAMMIKLLKRALSWKTYDNLYEVCVYLGAESDERAKTIEGCKMIISEDLDYWIKKE